MPPTSNSETTTARRAHHDTNSDEQQQQQQSLGLKDTLWHWWQRYCCISPTDEFSQVLRKTSASVLFPCSPIPLAFAMYYVKIGFYPDELPAPRSMLGVQIQSVALFFYAITVGIPYVMLRIKRHLSTAFMDGVTFMILLNSLVMCLCLPQFPLRSMVICAIIFAILAQTHYVAWQCALGALLYFLSGSPIYTFIPMSSIY